MGTTADNRRRYVKEELIPREDLRPFIGGAFVEPHGEAEWKVTDPMTGGVLATMPLADEVDAGRALRAAEAAFCEGPWRRMHPRERAERLLRLASLIEGDLETLRFWNQPMSESVSQASAHGIFLTRPKSTGTTPDGPIRSLAIRCRMWGMCESIHTGSQSVSS